MAPRCRLASLSNQVIDHAGTLLLESGCLTLSDPFFRMSVPVAFRFFEGG